MRVLNPIMKCCVLGIVMLGMPLSALGAHTSLPITTLYSTGVDAGGLVIAPGGGATDPNWAILERADGGTLGPAVVQLNNPAWLPNDTAGTAGSSWISINDDDVPVADGTYRYQTTFDLTGLVESTAAITGTTSPDDLVTGVFLNGVSQGITANDFVLALAFAINSDFIAGVNTLEFVMFNRDGGGTPGVPSPHGLRVELSGTADVIPEPSSFVLSSLALLGLCAVRRRRHGK